MSMEFRIKQYGEKHCYSNWTMNLKSFLTALYSNENPYDALMNLNRNEPLSEDNYTHDKRNGSITYDIDFDRDTITRHEKGKQFKLSEMSKVPLGAAYSLLRFHGEPLPATVSDYEFLENEDMSNLFGSRSDEYKERGFVIIGIDDFSNKYLDYLKSTGGYNNIQTVNVDKTRYVSFDQCGYDKIRTFLLQKLQTKRIEVNRLEAEINEAFGIEKPFEMTITRQQYGGNPVVTAQTAEDELSQLIKNLDLNNHSYTFSLVTIDSEDYVTGDYVNGADDLDSLGILDRFDEDFSHDNIVNAETSYYIIGQSENDSERLPEEFCEEIMAHLNTAIEYADILEERNIKVNFNDYGFDEETSEDECEMG